MYDKFGRDWKTRDYFLLHLVCNGLQQVIIQGTALFGHQLTRGFPLSRWSTSRIRIARTLVCCSAHVKKSRCQSRWVRSRPKI